MSNPALSPASLSPAMFSVVLATGGLSLTANLIGLPRVALLLFWLNVGLLAVAWGATVVRTMRGFREMADDFTHAGRHRDFEDIDPLARLFFILGGFDGSARHRAQRSLARLIHRDRRDRRLFMGAAGCES